MKRRTLIESLMAVATLSMSLPALAAAPVIEVWKDPDCGCCKDWISHLEKNGFRTKVYETGNQTARASLGMAQKFASCHTARVSGYVIEGHVPAAEIQRMLREKPQALGLAVPGMPIGSPGMDGPEYKGRKDRFDVLLVQKNGSSQVYQTYHEKKHST